MEGVSSFAFTGGSMNQHLGELVNDFEGKVDAATRFLCPALEAGANCVLVGRAADFSAWTTGMEKHGLEPSAVEFVTAEAWLPARGVNSIHMARRLFDRMEESRARARSLSIVIDMAWVTEMDAPIDKVCHCEATCDHMLSPEPDVSMLCIYSVPELPCALLHAGMRTHPELRVADRPIPNPYFEAPAILAHEPHLNECSDDPEVVQLMLRHFLQAV